MKSGTELIAEERQRQIYVEGYTAVHDDQHRGGEIAHAGACYAAAEITRSINKNNSAPGLWPWDREWWKPAPDNRVRELVKAGALIAAEIDRLQRIQK